MEILICTDGSSLATQSAGLISKFSFPSPTRIVLLGVSEGSVEVTKISASMDQIERNLGSAYQVNRKMRQGHPSEEILAEALDGSFDLVLVGGGGSQMDLLHPQIGPTTGKLARTLHTHFLVARNIPDQFKKVLFCTGADIPESETMKLGGEWIGRTSAQVGLLHVIPVSGIKPAPSGDEQIAHDLLMERSIQQLRTAGMKNEITSITRRGLVVDEVLSELADGGYDLLVVGSHYQPGQDRWQGTLLDDITDQLINRSTCSVLII